MQNLGSGMEGQPTSENVQHAAPSSLSISSLTTPQPQQQQRYEELWNFLEQPAQPVCYPVNYPVDPSLKNPYLLDPHMGLHYQALPQLNSPIHQLQLLGQDPLPDEEKKWLQDNVNRLSMDQQFALRQTLQDSGDASFFTLIGDTDLSNCPNETIWKIYDYTKALLNPAPPMYPQPNYLLNPVNPAFLQQSLLTKRKRSDNYSLDGPQMKRQKLQLDDPNKYTIKIEVVSGTEKKDGRYQCGTCDEVLYDKSSFEKHTRKHTKEKKYQCKICKKYYGHSQTLKEHMFTHLKMKPFKCTTCGKGFASAANLKRHMRIHTGVKPYKCTHCGKRFNQSGNLKAHIKRMHKDRE